MSPRPRALVATALTAALALASGSCGPPTAEEYGAVVARSPGFSPSLYNAFACTTCHAERASVDDPRGAILPGAPLAGALDRPSYWGGAVPTALEAVDQCYRRFQRGGPLDPQGADAVALYAYLRSLAPTAAPQPAVAFTVPRTVRRLPGGDPVRGAGLYRRACAYCHGDAVSGAGRLRAPRGDQVSVLPGATEAEHTAAMGYDQESLETVFVQKIRHGSFLGYGGVMPPFSTEVLPDAQVADIVAYLRPQLRP